MFKHLFSFIVVFVSCYVVMANDAEVYLLKTYSAARTDSMQTRVYVSGNQVKFSINAKNGNGYYKFLLNTEKQELYILSDIPGQENALVRFQSQELFEKWNFIFDIRTELKWKSDEKGFMVARDLNDTYLAKARANVSFPANDLLKLIHSDVSCFLVANSSFTPEWYTCQGKGKSVRVSWNFEGKVRGESFELKGDFKERDLTSLLAEAEKDASARLFLRQLLESW